MGGGWVVSGRGVGGKWEVSKCMHPPQLSRHSSVFSVSQQFAALADGHLTPRGTIRGELNMDLHDLHSARVS